MNKKVCVFVDGENFRKSIVSLFEEFRQTDYLPKNADWATFFDWLVSQASDGGERVRTYWYVIESIDFLPAWFPNAERKPQDLKRLLTKDDTLKQELENLEKGKLICKMKEKVQLLNASRDRMFQRFEGWKKIQDNISLHCPNIEFRRAGAIRYDLFKHSLGTEKAVDVKLATDLIMLRNIYDVAVILSGDQDYVPAVQTLKDSGKTVINVGFSTRGGKLLPGGARRLNMHTDWHMTISYPKLAEFLKIPTVSKIKSK